MTKHQRDSLVFLEDNLEFGNDLEKLSGKLQGMIHGFKVTDTGWSERVRSKARATPGGLRGCQGVASIDVAAGRCAIRSLLHRSQGLGLTLLAMSRDGAA